MHLGESEEVLLGKEGVHLDLEHRGLNLGVLDDINELYCADVGHTNSPDETVINESLHSVPGLLISDGIVRFHTGILGLGVMNPLGRVADSKVNILERDREVNNVQVKVVNLTILE